MTRFARKTSMIPLVGLFAACLVSAAANAEDDAMTAEDFRLYCGYLDALEQPAVKKLKTEKAKLRKIAKLAKVKRKKLTGSVGRAKVHGATCDEVGKHFESIAKAALDKNMPGRMDLFVLDYGDPSHVVASLRWVGGDKKKVVEEAALLAKTLATAAPFAKTIVMRAVSPRAKDRADDKAMWFEARTEPGRTKVIQEAKIKDYANSRYIRVFDGVKCSTALAHELVLGYARGPCHGKSGS